ncbi:MAG TPA: RecQ family ATP-dependent DNA helicase [Chlamydiales bacterium]|nr:RecQ family ATP-dependent DNA helicase [Chlamydiales bacterium]
MLIEQILRTTFGFQKFRPGQREAILALLQSGRLLCIQPTGHGKSLLYQLPTCLLGGITLVISPLLALMRDQVQQLNVRFKIPAGAINTDQTEEQNAQIKQDALNGKIKVLFVAPEQLDHVERFAYFLSLDIRLLVVDEAHCISTWGHDFRPSYRQIVHLLSALSTRNPQITILGLTATANSRVEEDIRKQLTLSGKPVVVMRETMERPNLRLSVRSLQGLPAKLAACVDLLSAVEGSGLIYCATRENVELVAEFLQLRKRSVAAYHAGFDQEDKKRLQEEFLADRYKALVATNALGMGIDKSNLRFIIHFDVPGSITAYYQEVGRCGRDGKPAEGFLLFDPSDRRIQEYFIESALPSSENFDQVLQAISTAKEPLNLTAIRQITGLHPTRVSIILAELLEQKFLTKTSQKGIQIYVHCNKNGSPDLIRYENQQSVRKDELQRMLKYGRQSEVCRMAILKVALGDQSTTPCGKCDICKPGSRQASTPSEDHRQIAEWLKGRSLPISPIMLYKVSEGLSIFDSKMRLPLFVRFMQQRNAVLSYQEMDEEFIELLLKHFSKIAQKKSLGGIIPIPSRTWKAQKSILHLLSNHFNLPVLDELLQWKETPLKRQGELLNNDQRHHNVRHRMQANAHLPIPPGALILFDDYIGSGNTLKETGRAIRESKVITNELIPFTIASIKWHLGKPGCS